MNKEHTTDLLNELYKLTDKPGSFHSYRERHLNHLTNKTLSDYLSDYLSRHPHLKISKIVTDSGLSKSNTYQVFSGRRKHPDKYKLVAICLAMDMSLKETNRALALAKQAALSPKNDLDVALTICLNCKYHTIARANSFLKQHHLNTL